MKILLDSECIEIYEYIYVYTSEGTFFSSNNSLFTLFTGGFFIKLFV